MKLSLSARVALGLVGQLLVFGSAVIYLVWAADSLFDNLSVLKDDLQPATEDLRNLVFELKAYEDLLSTNSRTSLDRTRDYLPRTRVFERLRSDESSLRRVSEWSGTSVEVSEILDGAAEVLHEFVEGDHLIPGVIKTRALTGPKGLPKTNIALFRHVMARMNATLRHGNEKDARLIARELLRIVRIARANVVRVSKQVLTASRVANDELFNRRSEISYAVVMVPIGALLVAVLVMILTLRALRPVRELAEGVRRLARGDYDTKVPERLSGELHDLAEALEALGRALKTREADLENKKDELMRAERLALVGRMASVVAHEVRNPLNSIALNVDLLNEMISEVNQAEGDRFENVIGAVQREIDRLSEITGEYLKFGRLPKGVLGPCDVCRVVRETGTFMESELTGEGVSMDLRTPDKPLVVVADEAQLRQALLNVLRNAVEAMPDGGKIIVEAAGKGERVVLSVTDTGPGIPKEFRPRLFEPFATTKQNGTGLGLAFVQQVAHECGGDVTIDSEEGEGTTIRILLKRSL